MKEKIIELINKLNKELRALNEYIYNNPELGLEEYKSSKAHVNILKKYGFDVEEGYIGIETAFKGEYKGKKKGPSIGFFVEYDALPEMGHGCGHNLLGTTSTGASIVLKELIDDIGGSVIVFGTPAEESNGMKVDLARGGELDILDVAMLAHPESHYIKSGRALALQPIEFIFKGRATHAAASPHLGINALDACILTFNGVNALREHILPSTKIHGIIKQGGEAANIVPDYVVAQFYIRAEEKDYAEEVTEKVINCARAGALATGAELEMSEYEKPYENMITNEKLSDIFTDNLKETGIDYKLNSKDSVGSIDMGDVSHVCPAIHPYFKITNNNYPLHTKEFRDETLKDYAYENMNKTIYALVMTAIDIIEDKKYLEKINEEFAKRYEK